MIHKQTTCMGNEESSEKDMFNISRIELTEWDNSYDK